jgi:hypothetical protein
MATTGLWKVNSVMSSNDLFGYNIYCYFNDQLHVYVYVYIALVEGDDVSADAVHRNKQEGKSSLLDRN